MRDKDTIKRIVEDTRKRLNGVGYKGALVIGKNIGELREAIKASFVCLLTDADIEEVKEAVSWIDSTLFLRKTERHENPTELFLFKKQDYGK